MPFELLVLNPSLILADSLDDEDLFLRGQPAFHRVVGQEQNDQDSHAYRDETEDEEQNLPGLEAHIWVGIRVM